METVKRIFYVFLTLIIVLCFSVGISMGGEVQERFGGTLKVGTATAPPTLDWPSTTVCSTKEVSKYIWEGFVAIDSNDKIQPMLAKEWKVSEDGLTWTFYLREGVLFHNGKEMTAEDAAASFERWVEICPYRVLITAVSSINAIDKYTVEVKLNERMGAMLALMAMTTGHCAIMPKEVCEGVPGGKLEEYIGTGPYKFAEWRLAQYIKLVKFNDYQPVDSEPSGYAGRKNAYLDEIIFYFIPEASTLLAGLETGEFDIVEPIQPLEVDRLEGIEEINLQRYPKWSLHTVFNTKGVFQSQKLRQAAVIALDMEEIMLSVGKKQENIELVSSIFRKDSIWYTGEREKSYNQKNTELAKKLMQEAGYDGEELILLTTKHYTWAFDMAISLVDQLSKIGFNIKMDVVDWPTLVSRRGKFEGWDMFTTADGIRFDPIQEAQYFMGNFAGWYNSPEVQEQMGIIMKEDDFEKRFNAWVKIEDHLCQDPNGIKPGYLFEFRGYRSNIKGLPLYRDGIFWNVYK